MDLVLKQLRMRNFLAIQEAVVVFRPGMRFISGENHDMGGEEVEGNGAGKTTIFDAIYWAVFGIILRDEFKADSVVNRRAGKNCMVALSFTRRGQDFAVVRYRKDDQCGNTVELFEGPFFEDELAATPGAMLPKRQTCHKAADTQALIEMAFLLDQRVWDYGIMVGQGMPHKFLSLPESAKQELLFKIVDVTMYDKALLAVREGERSAGAEVGTRQAYLKARTDQVAEKRANVDRHRVVLKDLETRLEGSIEAQKREIGGIDNMLVGHRKDLEEIGLKQEVLKTRRTEVLRQRDEVQREVMNLRETAAKRGAQIEHMRKEGSKLQGISGQSTCPVCLQPVDRALVEEHLKEAQRQHTLLQMEQVQATPVLSASNQVLEELGSTVAGIDREIDGNDRKARDHRSAVDALQRARSEKVLQLEGIRTSLENSKAVLSSMENELRDLLHDLEKLEEHVAEWKREQAHWIWWKTTVPNLRAAAVTSVLAYLNDRLAEYMQILSNGTIGVRLIQEEYGQGSRIKTELFTPAGCYGMSSGGERRRIDVGLYLALSDLIKSTAGISCNLLVADEITDSLSPAGVRRFLEILKGRAEQGACVMVVSHNPVVSQLYPFTSVMTVEKRNDLARIR